MAAANGFYRERRLVGNYLNDNLGTRVQSNTRSDAAEQSMVESIDHMRIMAKHKAAFDKLGKGTLDMPGFLRQLAPKMVVGLLATLDNEKASEKLKTNIRQDILDRAGHGKITKAITLSTTVDPNTTRRELMNLILTKAKAVGVTVEREVPEDDVGDVIDAPVVPDAELKSKDSNTDEILSQNTKPSSDNNDK